MRFSHPLPILALGILTWALPAGHWGHAASQPKAPNAGSRKTAPRRTQRTQHTPSTPTSAPAAASASASAARPASAPALTPPPHTTPKPASAPVPLPQTVQQLPPPPSLLKTPTQALASNLPKPKAAPSIPKPFIEEVGFMARYVHPLNVYGMSRTTAYGVSVEALHARSALVFLADHEEVQFKDEHRKLYLESQGYYMRLGLRYMLLQHSHYRLYVGVLGARASFTMEQRPFGEGSAPQASSPRPITSKPREKAQWVELGLGTSQRIFRRLNLYANFEVGLKLRRTPTHNEPCLIPGFGQSIHPTEPSIRLNLAYKWSLSAPHYLEQLD